MRKRKIIRGAFYTNTGATSDFTSGNITLSALTSDWWIYYWLNDTDEFKIAPTGTTNATTAPIVVQTDTTGVTSSPANWLSYTGDTQQITVINEDGYNVTSECNFNSTDTAVATVSSSGLMNMAGTGNTYIYASHPDSVTGTTSVTGYTYVISSLTTSPTGATIVTGTTDHTFDTITQDSLVVPNYELNYVSDDEGVVTVDSEGVISAVAAGTTIVIATHKYTSDTAGHEVTVIGA